MQFAGVRKRSGDFCCLQQESPFVVLKCRVRKLHRKRTSWQWHWLCCHSYTRLMYSSSEGQELHLWTKASAQISAKGGKKKSCLPLAFIFMAHLHSFSKVVSSHLNLPAEIPQDCLIQCKLYYSSFPRWLTPAAILSALALPVSTTCWQILNVFLRSPRLWIADVVWLPISSFTSPLSTC